MSLARSWWLCEARKFYETAHAEEWRIRTLPYWATKPTNKERTDEAPRT